jgi:hypothetical protein
VDILNRIRKVGCVRNYSEVVRDGKKDWWTRRDSNPRPPHCERGALPAELLARPWLTSGYNLIYQPQEIKGKSLIKGARRTTKNSDLSGILFPLPCSLHLGSCHSELIDKSARLRYSVQADLIGHFCRKENHTVRERERELRRRRKRKAETLRAKSKAARAEAAAKKVK